MELPRVRIIATGGTIDSSEDYDPTQKSVFSPKGSYLPRMLEEARVYGEAVSVEVITLKDSADITLEDRNKILERCRGASETRIVVTHGTDTMTETAAFLGKNPPERKTVVLVGSMVPFSHEHSDAPFNLGYAIASAQQLQPGIYVAMNGRVFDWNHVRKNRDKGIFETL